MVTIFRESPVIAGLFAMWRPLETFLDDGWPPIGERRFHDRASRMAVPVPYSDHAPTTVAS